MYGGTNVSGGVDSLSDLTLDKIDFEWIKSCKKIKFLKKALRLIEEDGIIIDLYT